jgi:hypothetical protein
MGLDNSVWVTMLVILLCSTFFLGFKLITHVDCSSFEIHTSGLRQQTNNVFYVGEAITFSIAADTNDKVQWNFGDGTPDQYEKNIIQHSFLKEDDYYVSCIINNKCSQTLVINIIPTPVRSNDTTQYSGIPIIGADTIIAGASAHFNTLIKAGYSYQWRLSGSPDIKTTAAVDFNFFKDGLQMITLTIDGSKQFTKTIVVLPKKTAGNNAANSGGDGMPIKEIPLPPIVSSLSPTSGGPGTNVTIRGTFFNGTQSVSFGGIEAKFQIVSSTEITATVAEGSQTGLVTVTTKNGTSPVTSPLFTYIAPKVVAVAPSTAAEPDNTVHKSLSDDNLKTLLTKVSRGDPNVTTQKVAEFFCGKEGTLVKVNSDKKVITLSELCKRLLETKDVTVESAKIVRDPNNPNCEINIVVSYSQPKKILGVKVGKKHE